MRRRDDPRVERIIDNVSLHLQARDRVALALVERPDQRQRNVPACDGILEGGGRRYAVEHTRLDSYGRQGEDQARFKRVLDPLHQRFWGRLGRDDLHIAIPVGAISAGYDWDALSRKVEEFVASDAWRALPANRSEQVSILDVPFPMELRREPVGEGGMLLLMRVASNAAAERVQAYGAIFTDNAAKFAYLEDGVRTVLVIESAEAIITNRETLLEEFRLAATSDNTEVYDDILLIQTGTAPCCVVPLKIGLEFQQECIPCWPSAPGYPPRF